MAKRSYPFSEESNNPQALKNQHLIQPVKQGNQGNTLYQLFEPLIKKDPPLISNKDLSSLADKFGNFQQNYIEPDNQRAYEENSAQYQNEHKGKIPSEEEERKQYWRNNPPPQLPSLDKRDLLGQQLGRFTIESLGKIGNDIRPFRGIQLDPNLRTGNQGARGLFKGNENTLFLNPNKKQDLLSTIVHEGNHALESYNPFIGNTVKAFLEKAAKKQPNQTLSKDYIPNLYKGVQDIINLPREFTNLYSANNPKQQEEITPQKLANTIGNPWAAGFGEIPAFALESMMRKDNPWLINEQTNPDSRKLLRRLMKETHQQYSNYGLVDKNKPLEGYEDYNYNKKPVQKYGAPEGRANYPVLSNALIDKIVALKNPNKNNPISTTTTTSSSGIQNVQSSYGQQNYPGGMYSTQTTQSNPLLSGMQQPMSRSISGSSLYGTQNMGYPTINYNAMQDPLDTLFPPIREGVSSPNKYPTFTNSIEDYNLPDIVNKAPWINPRRVNN